jgi:ribosome biogenesis SPOUT family RNA methylase Rps3
LVVGGVLGLALPRGRAAALILRPSSFILRPYPNHWHN